MTSRSLAIATVVVAIIVAAALLIALDVSARATRLEQRVISDAYIVTSAQETATVRALFTTRTPEPEVSR